MNISAGTMRGMNLPTRFFDRVRRGRTKHDCDLWTGTINGNNYGVLSLKGETKFVHRLMWEWTHGPIPKKSAVRHSCGVRTCVNPYHLFLETHKDYTPTKDGFWFRAAIDKLGLDKNKAAALLGVSKRVLNDYARTGPSKAVRMLLELMIEKEKGNDTP